MELSSLHRNDLAKSAGAALAVVSLGSLSLFSGIGAPLTALANRIRVISLPFIIANDFIRSVMWKMAPKISYDSNFLPFGHAAEFDCYPLSAGYRCNVFNELLLSGISEEILYRGFLERTFLPWVSKALPSSIGDLINRKISRIFLTTFIYAASHRQKDLSFSFSSGIVWGYFAEKNKSLNIPLLSHTLLNAFTMLILAYLDPQNSRES